MKRGKEDIDWSKVANTITAETITKPSPIKISVSEVLAKVKPAKIQASTAIQTDVVDKNGKDFRTLCKCNGYDVVLGLFSTSATSDVLHDELVHKETRRWKIHTGKH